MNGVTLNKAHMVDLQNLDKFALWPIILEMYKYLVDEQNAFVQFMSEQELTDINQLFKELMQIVEDGQLNEWF